jgi:hypothetical protein
MADNIPDASLAACALAYIRSPPPSLYTGGVLDITADHSLLESIINAYVEDNFAQQLTKDIAVGSIEGATISNRLLSVGSRLVIPQDLQVQELLYNLAHDTLGHFGFDKSYEALCGSYYWPNMHCDLEKAYIPSCTECQWNKNCTSKPTGPLHPFPVPDKHFDVLALNFIGPLPRGERRIQSLQRPISWKPISNLWGYILATLQHRWLLWFLTSGTAKMGSYYRSSLTRTPYLQQTCGQHYTNYLGSN